VRIDAGMFIKESSQIEQPMFRYFVPVQAEFTLGECRRVVVGIGCGLPSRLLRPAIWNAAFWASVVVYLLADSSVLAQPFVQSKSVEIAKDSDSNLAAAPLQLIVLGIAQDAGFPQAGCDKACCAEAWKDHRLRRMVASIAVVDPETGRRYLFDCTPDFPDQLRLLDKLAPQVKSAVLESAVVESTIEQGSTVKSASLIPSKSAGKLDGIFLTHAHIGHYSGLIHLGREVMGAASVPVHAMPQMRRFLESNGPWSQLIKIGNIELSGLKADQATTLGRMKVTPFLVPHRDEFSETVGFRIEGPKRSAVFLPDIDKWSKWDGSIEDLLRDVDVAYIDGTFFENGEIPGRDMALIPHPFVAETINRFAPLDEVQRKKVRFIHLNHTNPALRPGSAAVRQIEQAGMRVAVQGEVIEL
jgi:pyrroloquinoline quinone biosynthesis protein B